MMKSIELIGTEVAPRVRDMIPHTINGGRATVSEG